MQQPDKYKRGTRRHRLGRELVMPNGHVAQGKVHAVTMRGRFLRGSYVSFAHQFRWPSVLLRLWVPPVIRDAFVAHHVRIHDRHLLTISSGSPSLRALCGYRWEEFGVIAQPYEHLILRVENVSEARVEFECTWYVFCVEP